MASTIELVVMSGDEEVISRVTFTVEYGDENQRVVVYLNDHDDGDVLEIDLPDAATPSIEAFRIINGALVEHSILNCQSNRDNA